jgi:hypothetical protein
LAAGSVSHTVKDLNAAATAERKGAGCQWRHACSGPTLNFVRSPTVAPPKVQHH